MHLLSGVPAADLGAAPATQAPVELASTGEIVALKHDLGTLRQEVSELRTQLGRVMDELGLSR
jgi:hypothetical protein